MSKIALGIYLRPNSCGIGFVNQEGHCIGSQELPLDELVIDSLIDNVEQLQARFQVVTFHCIGVVQATEEVPTNIFDKLTSHFQVPLSKAKAGEALALFEYLWGEAQHETNFLAISLHTSIDGGLFINGKIAQGHQGLAGSLGDLLVHEYQEPKKLLDYLSEDGIKNMASRLMGETPMPSVLRSVAYQDLNTVGIIEAAVGKDPLALQVFDRIGTILGRKLSDMMNYFSPKYFILSSASPLFTDLLIKYAYPKMEEQLFPIFKGKVTVMASKSEGEHSLALQASAVAFA